MTKLRCVTRGKEQLPQGKPRVYFTCHPDDFERYFDEIKADIFEQKDCVIYYKENLNEIIAPSDLSQMQLVVFPVSKRLLEDPRLLEELRLAREEHHIRMLPISMQALTREVYDAFNQRFEAIHIIEKIEKNIGDYREKLIQHLNTALVSDELSTEIRKTFRKRVFLSYRKCDRIHAYRLIAQIHSNEALRDVAIWFDEYLIPGENYNNAIDDAIARCDVVLLALTPNVLIPGNYVLNEEYPNAKRLGKRILPVVMEETDGEALSAALPQLPPVLKFEKIEEALCASFSAETTACPDYDYHIGLAYLNGVEMEISPLYAEKFLRRAGNADHLGAILQLVDMYEEGVAVPRDFSAAVAWQKKAKAVLTAQYREQRCVENEILLLKGMLKLASLYHVLERETYMRSLAGVSGAVDLPSAPLATAELEAAIHQILSSEESIPSHAIERKRLLLSCYDELVQVAEFTCDYDTSEDCYKKRIAHCAELVEMSGEVKDRKALSEIYFDRGRSNLSLGDVDAAKADFGKATQVVFGYEELLGYEKELMLRIAIAWNAAGLYEKGDSYQWVMKQLTELAEAKGDPTLWSYIAVTYHMNGDQEKAKEIYASLPNKSRDDTEGFHRFLQETLPADGSIKLL